MRKHLLFGLVLVINTQFFWAQCYRTGEKISSGWLLNSSGDDILDNYILEEHKTLEDFFSIDLDFHFLIESQSTSAMFVPNSCETGCPGSVLLGIGFINEYKVKYKAGDNLNVLRAVLAHEFGHAAQHFYQGWQKSNVSIQNNKWKELHADFMAGYYVGKQNHFQDSTSLSLFCKEFYEAGTSDFSDFWDIDFHGTPEERGCAFLEGYCFAKETNLSIIQALEYGFQYVTSENPCVIRRYKSYVNDLSLGNVGKIKIYSTDFDEYLLSVMNVDGYVYKSKVNNQKNQFASLSNLATSFMYHIRLDKRSIFAGTIQIATLSVKPIKDSTFTMIIHNKKVYTDPRLVKYYLELIQKRKSSKWTISTGLYIPPLPIGIPLTFQLERKLNNRGLSGRINFQFANRRIDKQTELKNSNKYRDIGIDLKKSIYIPFIKSAFLGPTFHYANLKVDDIFDNIENYKNLNQVYLGLRFGGGRYFLERFKYNWDFSLGYRNQYTIQVSRLFFDFNFTVGYSF